MRSVLSRRITVFSAIMLTVTALAVAGAAYQAYQVTFSRQLEAEVTRGAELLAGRVDASLQSLEREVRIIHGLGPKTGARVLDGAVSTRSELLGMAVASWDGKWAFETRFVTEHGTRAGIRAGSWADLESRFPTGFAPLLKASVPVFKPARLPDDSTVLRFLVPLESDGPSRFLSVLISEREFARRHLEARGLYTFIIGTDGKLISQSSADERFSFSEELSHLPVVDLANRTGLAHGALEYREFPDREPVSASFRRLKSLGLLLVTQVPTRALRQSVQAYLVMVFSAAGAVLFVGILLTALFSRGLIGDRLTLLSSALKRVKGGNLSLVFPKVDGKDEIGQFSELLRSSFRAIHKRERLFGTLTKFRSQELRQLLSEDKIRLTGEMRNAVVMQCQIRGLDELAQEEYRAKARAAIQVLNRFAREAAATVGRFNGVVDQLSGGVLTAFWGAPLSDARDAENAMRAGVALLGAARAMEASLSEEGLPPITVSIGIHLGPVVAGEMGWDGRTEYSIMGSPLRIALDMSGVLPATESSLVVSSHVLATAVGEFDATELNTTIAGGIVLFRIRGETGAAATSDPVTPGPAAPSPDELFQPQFAALEGREFTEADLQELEKAA